MNQRYNSPQHAYMHSRKGPYTGGRNPRKVRIKETGQVLSREAVAKLLGYSLASIATAIIRDREIAGVHLEYVE